MVDAENGMIGNERSAVGDATSEDTAATPTQTLTPRDTSINVPVPPTERLVSTGCVR